MIRCNCIVQAGQTSDLQQETLQDQLNGFTTAAFGEGAEVAWVRVAPGYGFTAGQPSTTSVVSMAANEPLSPARRKSLLRQLVSLWRAETGCTVDELVAVIADPQAN